jgi:hypothetical protein
MSTTSNKPDVSRDVVNGGVTPTIDTSANMTKVEEIAIDSINATTAASMGNEIGAAIDAGKALGDTISLATDVIPKAINDREIYTEATNMTDVELDTTLEQLRKL